MVLFRIDSLCFSVSACAGVNITATTRSFSLPMRTGTNVSVYHLCPKSSVLCQPYSPLVSYVSYPFTSHLESSGLSVVFHAISAPFRGSDGATTFGRHVQNGVTRKLVGRMSISQLQYISGTSSAAFAKWASQHQSIETCTDDIGEGAKLHWIGNKKSNKVMFHLHGGGYCILPLSAGLLQ